LTYPSPDAMVKDFLRLAGEKGVVFSEVRKGEPPVEFRMEGATWALISVYNVSSSKFPVQGAHVEEDEFCYGMRDLDLSSLLSKRLCTRLSISTAYCLSYVLVLYSYTATKCSCTCSLQSYL
jgi:hypothetical protein